MDEKPAKTESDLAAIAAEPGTTVKDKSEYICDRCGATMTERNCKIICRNCGHRFDCSDLNIYFD